MPNDTRKTSMRVPITRFRIIASMTLGLLLSPATVLSASPPSFAILAPTQGASVSSPVILQVEVHNATIGRPIEGLDHLHLSVDGGPEVAIYQNGLLRLPLEPGKHSILVELAGPTHEALLPPKKVDFAVR